MEKNNEGTINLGAVNSHLSEQHVRFLCDTNDISDMFSSWTGPLDCPQGLFHTGLVSISTPIF